MRKRSKKSKPRSGATISPEERDRRGYGRVTFSLSHVTNTLIDGLAARLGTTRSGVIVHAVDALLGASVTRTK